MKGRYEAGGLLPVLKQPGLTSHDVVARARRLLGLRRIGHAGTLDPGAAGLLLLLVGRGARLAELLQAEDKTYVAEMFLGAATDTQDAFGTVLQQNRNFCIDRARLEKVMKNFVGPSLQLPPMTSAVRQGGRRLYELAREGLEAERPSRPVEVYELTLLRVDATPPGSASKGGGEAESFGFGTRVTFRVACSKGTYVRTLCHDIGEKLGCGAFMSFLLRTRTGDIGLEEARTLDDLEREAAGGAVKLLPLDAALRHVPAATLTPAGSRAVRVGQSVGAEQFVAAAASSGRGRKGPGSDMLRLYGDDGAFLALARPDPDTPGRWRPRIVFSGE